MGNTRHSRTPGPRQHNPARLKSNLLSTALTQFPACPTDTRWPLRGPTGTHTERDTPSPAHHPLHQLLLPQDTPIAEVAQTVCPSALQSSNPHMGWAGPPAVWPEPHLPRVTRSRWVTPFVTGHWPCPQCPVTRVSHVDIQCDAQAGPHGPGGGESTKESPGGWAAEMGSQGGGSRGPSAGPTM